MAIRGGIDESEIMNDEERFIPIRSAAQDGSIEQWDMERLQEALKIAYGPTGLAPYEGVKAVRNRLEFLIQRKLSEIGHAELGKVKGEITDVKREVNEVNGTLERTHRIHFWILVVAVVTAILAGIAALDVIDKWFGTSH